MPEDDTAMRASETTSAPAASTASPTDHTSAPAPGLSPVASTVGQTNWRDALLNHVQRYTRYPPILQGRRVEGVVYVRIMMDCRGKLLDKSIYRKSGYADLDREAMATLERAEPLPAPQQAPDDRVELVLPIHFVLR